MSSFSIRPSKEKNVNKHTSSNIRNSMSNGIKIFFKPRKKTLKLSESSKIDTLRSSRPTGKPSRNSYHLHLNSLSNCSTTKRFREILQSKRTTRKHTKSNKDAKSWRWEKETNTWMTETRRLSPRKLSSLKSNSVK